MWSVCYKTVFCALFFWGNLAFGQIGIGTTSPASDAELELSSTSQGLLIPRMSTTQMDAISNPAEGLMVFNTNAKAFYYFDGSQWLSTLNSYKIYANAGVDVSFDNLSIRIPTSGNRSVQLKSNSSSINISGSSINVYISNSAGTSGSTSAQNGWNRESGSLGTSYAYWQSTATFPMHGSIQEIFLTDETNDRSYRILCIIGSGYNNNFFEIERLR